MAAVATVLCPPVVAASHVSSPARLRPLLMSAHHSLSRVTAAGAWNSSQPSMLVLFAPLWSSGAAGRLVRTGGVGKRGLRLRGRRAGRTMCLLVIPPRTRCVAFQGFWRLMVAAEGWIFQPSTLPRPRPLICGRVARFGAFWGVWDACIKRNTKSSLPVPPSSAPSPARRRQDLCPMNFTASNKR